MNLIVATVPHPNPGMEISEPILDSSDLTYREIWDKHRKIQVVQIIHKTAHSLIIITNIKNIKEQVTF